MGQINDENWDFLHDATGLSKPFNDMYFRYLRDLGYTGSLQDMITKSGMGLNPSGLYNPASGVGALSSLFANGENGFLFDDMSDLTRLFTTANGGVQVAANDDTVGLMLDRSKWAGKTLAQIKAEQTVLAASGYTLSVNGGTGTATESPSGQLNLTGDNTNPATADKSFATEVNALYAIDCDVLSNTVAVFAGTSQGGTQLMGSQTLAGPGSFTRYFIATGTTSWVRFLKTTASLVQINNIKIRKIPGNQAVRDTSTMRPLWKAGADPYILPDGVDDGLYTPFIPTPALTMAVAVRFPATSGVTAYIAMGGGASTGNKRAFIGKNVTNGTVAVGWGDESLGHYVAGSDLGVADHVIVLTGDAASRDIWVDNSLVHTRVPTLGPDGTGGGVALGFYNNGGSSSTASSCRIYAAMAMNRRATSAEISLITSNFQRKYS